MTNRVTLPTPISRVGVVALDHQYDNAFPHPVDGAYVDWWWTTVLGPSSATMLRRLVTSVGDHYTLPSLGALCGIRDLKTVRHALERVAQFVPGTTWREHPDATLDLTVPPASPASAPAPSPASHPPSNPSTRNTSPGQSPKESPPSAHPRHERPPNQPPKLTG